MSARQSENTGNKNQGTRAMQCMKTRQQRNATTVATNIGQVETIVRHGANSAHFVKAKSFQ